MSVSEQPPPAEAAGSAPAAPDPSTPAQAPAAQAPYPATGAPDPVAGPAAEIAAGYAFDGAALDLGALLWDGTCHPDAPIRIPLPVLNRHGLVAGATGTGKTKTLQLIAEQLSAHGVPVFLADVKGDVAGVSAPGEDGERVRRRAAEVGQEWRATGFPCEFYGLGGVGPGIPVRATVTGFGPVLLSKVLRLNRTQEQSLGLIFHYADSKGLELVDLKDLRAVVTVLSEKGAPTPVAATRLRAPESLMGPVDAAALDAAVKGSPLYGRYAEAVDRASAYERLTAEQRAAEAAAEAAAAEEAEKAEKKAEKDAEKEAEKEAEKKAEKEAAKAGARAPDRRRSPRWPNRWWAAGSSRPWPGRSAPSWAGRSAVRSSGRPAAGGDARRRDAGR